MIKGISLKKMRLHLDINQTDLSEYLGVSRTHLNMIERNRRSVPPEVHHRMTWTESQIEGNIRAFKGTKNQQIHTNKLSVDFAWKTHKKKRFDLETAEMELNVMLRENIDFARKVYLFKNLKPMPGLNSSTARVFTAWKKYHARLAMEKLELAGPEMILRQRMKIAAMKAELECLEMHLSISPKQTKKSR